MRSFAIFVTTCAAIVGTTSGKKGKREGLRYIERKDMCDSEQR